MKNTMLVFVEMNNADEDIVLNPASYVEVENLGLAFYETRLFFKLGTADIIVDTGLMLDDWLK
jgi:hypothetical protein